ncbi:putative vacuolar protein sorting-associated protein Tda6p [Trichomonascus vanleenenianus]|uniref:putative vacuolar protein sorting-associated protein Tda6p n=1 Tax=Trichomonascus vanleenenianus TaxID=2268995 RepID=UPI003ECA2EA7
MILAVFVSLALGWLASAATIPGYITQYAPVVRLYSEERYMPYGIDDFVRHFRVVDQDYNALSGPLHIEDLQRFNRSIGAEDLFLESLEDFDSNPDWITGVKHWPDVETGRLATAPAVCIVVDRGEGQVDAFWFYFYSFNLGPFVMGGGPYGNHVGDWEHSLVRFRHGKPEILWMSAHGGGSAYRFDAMETVRSNADRPVIFSARGTHANYASVGQHSHDLPFYMLSDFTDRGALWDPAQNFVAYTFDGTTVEYANGTEPGREERWGKWLEFLGHWGDQKLSPLDPRQKFHPFEWRYIDGPLGPLTKNLIRDAPCQRSKWWNFMKSCRVRHKVQMGEGIDAEGGGCGLAFDNVRPLFIQYILRLLTWKGIGCFLVDRLWG